MYTHKRLGTHKLHNLSTAAKTYCGGGKICFNITISPEPFDYSMTLTSKLLLLSGAAVLVAFYSRAQNAGNLNFYPKTVQDVNISGGNVQLTAKVLVQNTSSQALTLRSIAGNAYANNFLIGNGKNFAGVIVAGNSEVLLPITFELFWIGIVQDIVDAFYTGVYKQVIEWTPSINIEGLPIQQLTLKFTVG